MRRKITDIVINPKKTLYTERYGAQYNYASYL